MTSQPVIRRGVKGISSNDPIRHILSLPIGKAEVVDRGGRLYASQVGMCARAGVLSALEKYTTTPSVSSSYYRSIGKAVHDVVAASFEAADVMLGSEVRTPQLPFNLGGYIDVVIMIDGEPKLVEIKTCGKLPSQPHKSHYAQASLYAALVGLPFVILYVSRNIMGFNSLQIEPFHFPAPHQPPEALFNMVYASLAVKARKAPGVPFEDDTECKFCDHLTKCWFKQPLSIPELSPVEEQQLRTTAARMATRMMRKENVAYRQWCFFKNMALGVNS